MTLVSYRRELIGTPVTLVCATHAPLVGFSGFVTDETRNTLIINNKRIVKDCVTLQLFDGVLLDGRRLVGRSWQRLKQVRQSHGYD